MKLTGAGAAIAATGAVGAASAIGEVDADTVVDLGEKGLSEGDRIDPYIEEYWNDGVEVHVPAGEYEWGGRGFNRAARRNAAIIGQGEVILNAVEGQYRNQIIAEEGTVAIKNFTVRGTVEASRNRLEAVEGARVVVENWNFPDGSISGSTSSGGRAFYCPGDHAGEVVIRGCYVKGFDDNGIYATSPGKGEGGRVVVENCFLHNNNIAGIRIGGHRSTIRNCTVLNDDSAPRAASGGRNQRGIRIGNYEHSQDMLIENVDVIHSGEELGGGGPIRWSKDSPLSTGHMENVRVYNTNDGVAAIGDKEYRAEGWTGNDIKVAGDGNLDVPDWFTNVRVGDKFDVRDPTNDSVSDGTEIVMVTTDSGGIDYTFTATGPITPLYNRDSYRANRSEPTDYAEENDDGTWTAYGQTAGGSGESGDSFLFEGDLTEFSVTGDVDSLTLYADGEELTVDELMDEYGGSVDDETDDDSDESADDSSDADPSGETELVMVTTDSGGIDYTFTATGPITPLYDRDSYRANRSEPTDYAEENDDGTWTAYGQTAGGSGESGDSFLFEGGLTEFSATGDVDSLTLYADGNEVTMDELMDEYGGSVDDDPVDEPDETDDGSDETDETDDGTDDTDEGTVPDDSLSNRIIVDGTRVNSTASYAFKVTGDVAVDEAISSEGESRWDAMDDIVEDGSVTGVVRKGIDGFRYSGEITSISVDGTVDISIESTDL